MSIAASLRKLKQANYRETEPISLPDGTQVILSTLTGAEDREIASYLQEHADGPIGHYTKRETLCHAIKWVAPAEGDPIDLHGVELVETGETNDAGVPIKVKRSVMLREVVDSWPDLVVDALFTKWATMIEDMENHITKIAKIELGDTGLLIKIDTVQTELNRLVLEAHKRGLELDPDLIRFFSSSTMGEDKSDALFSALRARGVVPEDNREGDSAPEPDTHLFDEQLERERSESPEIYPVEETPQSIRR